jgi:uncharacterized membrane protein YphA (DoxX/SURF4 family)
MATAAEAILGLLLVFGWKTRTAALLSGLLLISFALTNDDLGFGCEGVSQSLGIFGRRGSAAPGSL